ncbi:hypothetical protein P3L10_000991 [Capsicum annuum]
MGKDDLWDDSALINAFNDAVSKGHYKWYQSNEPISTGGSNSKKMFVESSTLVELVERNNAKRMTHMDGMSDIVVNVKQLQRWCEDCICSIDCQCDSCVYGCVRIIDCHCYICHDDCLREKNEEENRVEMMESMGEIAEQKDKSSVGVCFTGKCNELNECVEIEAIITTMEIDITESMHNKGAKASSNEGNLTAPDDGSNELKSNREGDDSSKVAPDTITKMGDSSSLPSVKENSSFEAVPPENHNGQLNEQNTQDKVIESDQRQKILQKLNQFGISGDQNSGSTSQEHQVYVSQNLNPIESSFYCPYGCQSWVSPCTASPCCLGGDQDGNLCNTFLQRVQEKNSSPQNPNLVNIVMEAAEKALSSLKQASNTASLDSFAKEVQENK